MTSVQSITISIFGLTACLEKSSVNSCRFPIPDCSWKEYNNFKHKELAKYCTFQRASNWMDFSLSLGFTWLFSGNFPIVPVTSLTPCFLWENNVCGDFCNTPSTFKSASLAECLISGAGKEEKQLLKKAFSHLGKECESDQKQLISLPTHFKYKHGI